MASNKSINVSRSTFLKELERRKALKQHTRDKHKEEHARYKDKIKECYYVKRKGKRPRPLMLLDRRWCYGDFVYGDFLKDFKRYNKEYRMNIECVFIDNDNYVRIPANYDRSDIKDPNTGLHIQKGVLIKRLFFPKAISFLFANGIHGDYRYKNLIPITQEDVDNGDYAFLPDDKSILISKDGKVFNIDLFRYLDSFKPSSIWEDDNEYFVISNGDLKTVRSLAEMYKQAFGKDLEK